MTPQALFELATGPFGAFALLCVLVVALVAGKWLVPYPFYQREVERVEKLDEQADASTELLRKIISSQERAEEREKVRRDLRP